MLCYAMLYYYYHPYYVGENTLTNTGFAQHTRVPVSGKEAR